VEVVSPLIGQEARGLVGLHLYHYGLSNCSQKVRIVLAEKGLGWTNHHVDLTKGEHATESYRRINPNGVVPTLVHDGTIVIESSDIMEHLDEHFPDPPLRPTDERELARMRQWIARQESIQRPLQVLSREFLFLGLDDDGHAAHRSRSTIAGAIRVVDDALAEVNRHLVGRTWIVGNALSLADVAWMVDVHRFAQMRFPMGNYADLRAWYRRVRRLTSFQQAVLSYESPTLRRRFALYVLRRWVTGSHCGAPRWRNPRLLADA
jgi:glutathione S-transferase